MKLLLVALLAGSQAASPVFRFETDGFWLNLHHYLYVLGRAEAKIPDSQRAAVAGAPADEAAGLKGLSDAERARWRQAVAAYAGRFSTLDTVFDSELFNLTNALRRASGDRAARTLQIDVAAAEALDRAAPIYRKAWWPRHRDANRRWVQSMQAPIEKLAPPMLAYVTRAYQEPWMAGGFPVNVSAFSNWAGAYSTYDSLLVVSSMHPGNRELHGFEITVHEAMHQWDEEIDERIRAIARANKLKFHDLLSHAMIFYTTGEAMKRLVPTHVPYAEIAGIWKGRMGVFKPALDAHWKPYLDGRTTQDEALLGLLRAP
jgi:hypothetical protein